MYRMKKITIKKALILLAFIFIGSTTFAQIQPAGTWSAIGDVTISKVTTDADNGDGAGDGALNIDGTTSTVGQGILFTFDGTMQEGNTYAINSHMFNSNGSYVKVRVTLHNKTDDTELAVDVDGGTIMQNGDVHNIDFSYTAIASDAGDVLELRYTRNDDGNTARNFNVDNAILNGNTLGARTLIYSEDFRYANTGRGFEAKIMSDGGHSTPGNILTRLNDIPDSADSNNLFDPSIDREANRIPNGAVRDQKVISTSGSDNTTNYAVDAYAVFTTLDLTDANTLINPSDDYVYASFWTQRRYGDGDIATVTVRAATNYTGDPSTTTWTTLPLHSGKLGDSSDGRKYVKAMVDLSAYNGSTTVTLAIRYLGSSSAYSGSNRNGTFYISDLQFIAQETPVKNVWNGNSDSDLSKPANWDTKAAPVDTNNNLVIPGGLSNYPTATTALTVNSLTLESGASFITTSTLTGNVTYNRNLGSENWYLVSSPVAGETYDDAYVAANSLAINGANNAISTYAPADDTWSYMETGDAAANFNAGQGYSVRLATGQSTGDISFTGTINTASVETPSLAVGFNLLGNPYTSYVNSATFLGAATSANLDQTQIWLWNQATGMYEVKTSGDAWVLAPGQGFFVNATSAGTVTFDESNQAATGNAFLKSAKTEVKLVLSDGENNRFAKLNFGDNFSKGYDYGWEGETFGGIPNSLSIFTSLVNDNVGKRYQVQSLPNSDYESMVVPMGITAAVNKEITFSAEALNLPEDLKVFLEDRSNNTFTRLDEANTTYKVTLDEKLDGVGRFYVHTTQSALSIDNVALTGVSIFKANATTLRVTGLQQGEASISLFNVLGKQVMSTSFEATASKDIYLPKLATGVYFAQVQTATGKLSKKIILE